MKDIRKIALIGMLNLFYTISLYAQDIHFSQFFNAPASRNPALAGIFTGDIKVHTIYRDQWNSITDAYRSASLGAEYKMHIGKSNDFITTGLQILYDKAGTIGLTTTGISPILNYHKSLSSTNNRYLSLGFSGGIVQRSIDRSKITTNSQYDGGGDGEILLAGGYSYADGSFGMSYNSQIKNNPENNFFIAAAYHHFNRPKNSFYKNPGIELYPKLVFSAGIKTSINEYTFLIFQGDHSQQGAFSETVAGVMYGLKLSDDPDNSAYAISGGAFIRWNDALIPIVKLDYNPFSIAISYDANISKLKPSTFGRGGFELAISFIGFIKRDEDRSLTPRF